jgi:hypothetical protein
VSQGTRPLRDLRVAYCGGKTVALSQRGGARSVHRIGHQIEPITEEVPVLVERP